jgi:hypothetical protein
MGKGVPYNYTKDCIHPHSVMKGILHRGSRFRYRGGNIIYTVIEVTEYDNPYGYFTINSRYYFPDYDQWKETKSHSGQLQPMFERGNLIPLGETIQPMEYIRPHTCNTY